MAFEVFKGLMQMENARVSKAHAKRELDIKESYMTALTANQNLQTDLLTQKLDAGLAEAERQFKANQLSISKEQLKVIRTRNIKIKEWIKSDDPDKKMMAMSAIFGVTNNAKQKQEIDMLKLGMEQQKFELAKLTFGLRETMASNKTADEQLGFLLGPGGKILEEREKTAGSIELEIAKKAAEVGGIDPNTIGPKRQDFIENALQNLTDIIAAIGKGGTGQVTDPSDVSVTVPKKRNER